MAAETGGRVVMARLVPPWMRIVLLGSTIWLAVAVMRGVTFALTHAAHAM